jgi:hypothetical protein
MEKNFFERELRKLFEGSETLGDPRFAGRICMARLSETTNVKLTFVTLGFADKYDGIEAKVLNRNEGPIDTAVFRFADILGRKAIPNNPNFRDGLYPHVWKTGGKYEWYAYRPTPGDFELIADTVSGYLEMFKTPVQTQGMTQQME